MTETIHLVIVQKQSRQLLLFVELNLSRPASNVFSSLLQSHRAFDQSAAGPTASRSVSQPARRLVSQSVRPSVPRSLGHWCDRHSGPVHTYPDSKLFPSTRSVFKSNLPVHTYPTVSGFTLVPKTPLHYRACAVERDSGVKFALFALHFAPEYWFIVR